MIYQLVDLSFFVLFATLLILWTVAKTIYRLYLHPLRSFPGPIFASVTNWHMFYYNWYCNGIHSMKIKQWHEKYGPIVRIAPNELHFSHPDAYRSVYTHNNLRKDPAYYKFMGQDSLIGRLDIEDSKKHRRMFGGFFSTSAIRTHSSFDGILTKKANELCTTLALLCSRDQKPIAVNMTEISRCFTYDVLHEMALGPSDVLSTTSPGFKPPFADANSRVSAGLWLAQKFLFLVTATQKLPNFLLTKDLSTLRREKEECRSEVMNRSRALDGSQSPNSFTSPTICSQVLSARLRQLKISISNNSLGLEIFDFFMAGTELPANAISFGVFYVAKDPNLVERLRGELFNAGFYGKGQIQNLACLEKLPFLNAVVKETLRMGNLVPGRFPRVTPPRGISVAGQHVPGGTVVGASSYLIHMDPWIFPEPEKFIPERWLMDGSRVRGHADPERHLFAFSIGMRDCIGSNLAIAEIRTVIATVVSFFDVELTCPREYSMDLTWRDNIVSSYDRDVLVAIRPRKNEERDPWTQLF